MKNIKYMKDNLFKNVYLLYFIFLASIINVLWFVYYKNIKSIIIFATSCLAIYLLNKNMIFVLGLSIIITDILYIFNKKEGLDEIFTKTQLQTYQSQIDTSNNLNENMMNPSQLNESSKDNEHSDNESLSHFMEDKTIIKKLNPNVVDNIKNMNFRFIEELNKKINDLGNIRDL